jgi:hypothetical protein
MSRYPEHRFSATSAQQYKWLETQYPLLFDKVKGKIEDGQFGYIGATWGTSVVPSSQLFGLSILIAPWPLFRSRDGYEPPLRRVPLPAVPLRAALLQGEVRQDLRYLRFTRYLRILVAATPDWCVPLKGLALSIDESN